MTERYDERNRIMNATTMKVQTTYRSLLIAAVLVVVALGAGRLLWGAGAQLVHEPVSQPLGAAAHADVQIEMGIGHLRIGALDQPSNWLPERSPTRIAI